MEPSFAVALLWILFGGTHVGLATGRLRGELVSRLGVVGFTFVFSLVAAATFSLLVHTYALHRFEGAAGLALGRYEAFRWIAIAAIGAGMLLLVGGLWEFPRSPFALFGEGTCEPRGLSRITRHPFLVGLSLLALAHALFATRLVGTVAFGGFALFSILGAIHQDGKYLALRGETYDAYLSATSLLPFAAIAGGRQRLVWRELPWGGLALGLALGFALRAVHEAILGHGGAWVIGTTLTLGTVLTLISWRRARRGLPAEGLLERAPR
jgi:uncharacterized membrane protein